MSVKRENTVLIGFIGAPSCGKTTTALGLAYRLKQQEYVAEFVPEAARQKIIECRIEGIPGNGGIEGQKKIYAADHYLHTLYRDHAQSIIVSDGSTVNCFFYGLDILDLVEEANKYDLLFYIPLTETHYLDNDANRMQNRAEILEMGKRWDAAIRPLQQSCPHIVTLPGYPHVTNTQMVEAAYKEVIQRRLPQKIAA